MGVGAGNNNTQIDNTFVGYKAGANCATTPTNPGDGTRNTFVGHAAGENNDYGRENSFFGDSAGFTNLGSPILSPTFGHGGYHNTFIGASAGLRNYIGKSNTYIGFECGYGDSTGWYNTMTGRSAGRMAKGQANCYYGKDVGQSIQGNANSYYGSQAGDDIDTTYIGINSQFLTANSAFGANAGRFFEGSENCFFGVNSGRGITLSGFAEKGYYNSFFGGNSSGVTSGDSIWYSGCFGYATLVTGNHKIIIGTQTENTGFGLSGDYSFFGPRSRVEINADPTTTDTTGFYGSGLQFRQLTSHCTLDSNSYVSSYGRVLTVNSFGVVKLTDAFGLGYCSNPTIMSADFATDLNDHNIYYSGNGWNTGGTLNANNAIGIGYSCGTLPAKLSVDQNNSNVNAPTTTAYFHNGDNSSCQTFGGSKIGIHSKVDGVISNSGCRGPITNFSGQFEVEGSDGMNTGVFATAFRGSALTAITNIGGDFRAEEADNNIAVQGTSNLGSGLNSSGGIFESEYAGNDNFGVQGIVARNSGFGGGVNYDVYGFCPINGCSPSSLTCTNAAGFFNGALGTTGSGLWIGSDANLKENVRPIENAMSVISQLHPKRYNFKQGINRNLNLAPGPQAGLIAQELYSVLPELVKSFKIPVLRDSLGRADSSGLAPSYLAVNYDGLIPYLIGAANEQQHTIDSLATLLTDLQQQINNCCNAQGSEGGTHRMAESVVLNEVTTIILNQNTPNPFKEETYIDFEIPSTVKMAMIIIYDKLGNVLKSIPVSDRGVGSLHIYAENLSSGTYAYSLVCDGVTIDTKQMVCQK